MKRRFYALMLVVAMLAMTLVGCGSNTSNTTNTTNDATVNTEVENTDEVMSEEATAEQQQIETEPNTFIKTETYNVTHEYSEELRQAFIDGGVSIEEANPDPDICNWIVSSELQMVNGSNGDVITYNEEITQDEISENTDFFWTTSPGNANTTIRFATADLNSIDLEREIVINGTNYAFTINNFTFDGSYIEYVDCTFTLTYEGTYIETEEPVVEPTEEPTTEDTSENEEPVYEYAHTWAFPDGLEGFTRKFLNEDYPEWSVNHTHYVDPNGNEMNFRWEGPSGLGSNAGLGNNGKTLNLANSSGEYKLRAFTTGELSPEDYEETINYSKETIISFASTDVSYIEDGYYNAIIEDNYLSYTFAVEGVGDNANCQGYCHFILDFENGACYQFTYLEDISIYDDERALSVVNSLEYWDYIPEE